MKSNVLFAIILIYPVSPILSFLWLLFYNSTSRINISQIKLFSLLGAIIVGLINSNKLIEGDLLNYQLLYQSAEIRSFLEFTVIYGKDFFFTTLTYVLNKLTLGDFETYIFILTTSATFLLLEGISKLTRVINLNKTSSFFAVALTLSFYQIFEYSGHIIRQYLSICLLFYALGFYYEKKNKSAFLWILFSILSHSSSLIFIIPILYLKVKALKPRQVLKYIILLILIFICFALYEPIRIGLYFMFYRVFNPENNIVLQISPVVHVFSVVNLLMWVLIQKRNFVIRSLSNLQVYLIIISYLSLIVSSELFIRIIFGSYFLFYFLVTVLINQIVPDSKLSKYSLFILVFFNLGLFAYSLINSAWGYSNLSILLTPLNG